MPKKKRCEVIARLIPRLRTDDSSDEDTSREAAAISAEQRALEPLITEQTAYLVRRGEINGFTRQLQTGFRRQSRGE